MCIYIYIHTHTYIHIYIYIYTHRCRLEEDRGRHGVREGELRWVGTLRYSVHIYIYIYAVVMLHYVIV